MSEQPKPRKPRGKALPLTDAALDKAAAVEPDDMDAAVRWWKRYAPPEARELLEPKEEDAS